jgi:hypothetical protein
MFNSEAVRDFYTTSRVPGSDLEPSHTVEQVSNVKVYLLANDLTKAIKNYRYLPDAFIIPTNTELELLAVFPTTQALLIKQIQKDSTAFKALLDDVGKFRTGDAIKLQPAIEVFSATIKTPVNENGKPTLPAYICMIATDEKTGGSNKYRDFFTQYRLQIGIKNCLIQLDQRGAKSVVLPLIGSASGYLRKSDLKNTRTQQLMECRLANSIAGISLGVASYVSEKGDDTNIDEIGIVQWDRDLKKLYFSNDRKAAYKDYAEYVSNQLLPKTLKGNPLDYLEFGDKKSCEIIFGRPEP